MAADRHSRIGPAIFAEHPVRPVSPRDPLALLNEVGTATAATYGQAASLPKIGFACMWEPVPERTWSHTPWNLRAALRRVTETTDIGVQIPASSRTALKALHTRVRGGRLTTTWSSSRLTDLYCERALLRELASNPRAWSCDAVLTIQDVASLPIPFLTYQDISYDASVAATRGGARAYASLMSITPSILAYRRERQVGIYGRSAGIIAMSRWFARCLTDQTGVPPHKVHVVHPGISAGQAAAPAGPAGDHATGSPGSNRPVRARGARHRLLFIGRQNRPSDFYRKGGDLVVEALALLRRRSSSPITLTVAGPDTWPLPGSPPDGVRFLGPLPPADVAALFDSHDLFVMPSRLEPFGIVFAEAIARGLPCVARDACAMPEIVTPGVSGVLVASDDARELADAIAAALADDALYESCRERAPGIASYFSWSRAARQMTHVINNTLVSMP